MADCTGLENRRAARYREFESPPLRFKDSHPLDVSLFLLPETDPNLASLCVVFPTLSFQTQQVGHHVRQFLLRKGFFQTIRHDGSWRRHHGFNLIF